MECMALESQISQQLRRVPRPCPCLLSPSQALQGHSGQSCPSAMDLERRQTSLGGIWLGLLQLCPFLALSPRARHPASQSLSSLVWRSRVVYVFGPGRKLIFSGTLAACDPTSGANHGAWHVVGAQETFAEWIEGESGWCPITTVIIDSNNFAMRL